MAYCQEYLSISVTQTAICKCLSKLGIKWNRGKLKVTSPDALYSVKRERVEKLREKALQGNLSSHDAENADPSSEADRARTSGPLKKRPISLSGLNGFALVS